MCNLLYICICKTIYYSDTNTYDKANHFYYHAFAHAWDLFLHYFQPYSFIQAYQNFSYKKFWKALLNNA